MMNVIELKRVTVNYNNIELLKEINLTITAGKIVGIIGRAGSGKTTLLYLLSGALKPAAGVGTILGNDIFSFLKNVIKTKAGYIPASLGIDNDLTVSETMRVFSYLHKVEKQENFIENILAEVGLNSYGKTAVNRLTSKQKLFLSIGLSLLHKPQILLIDEPTSYLEADSRLEYAALLRHIADKGIAIVITTKFSADGAYCDETAFLHGGKLSVFGTTDALCRHFNVICFETSADDLIRKRLARELKHMGISYMSDGKIRVVNPADGGEKLKQYGFYKTQPCLEDVKQLYESVADL